MLRMRPLAAALLALLFSGCVEVEERLALERDGNGLYTLTLRWNADLLARVRDTVGDGALAAFEGRPFPLDVGHWRDGLAMLPGLTILKLDEQDDGAGWRKIEARVAFDKLESLLRWELLAGRPLSIAAEGGERQARLTMEPLNRLPLLDPLREALEARRAPPPAGPPSEARRDPAPLARLGLAEEQVLLVERMLAPHLDKLRLSFTVAPAGRVLASGPNVAEEQPAFARFAWTWADLLAGKPRTVELRWRAGEFDTLPFLDHLPER